MVAGSTPPYLTTSERKAVTRDVDRAAYGLTVVALIWLFGNPEQDYRELLPQLAHRSPRF